MAFCERKLTLATTDWRAGKRTIPGSDPNRHRQRPARLRTPGVRLNGTFDANFSSQKGSFPGQDPLGDLEPAMVRVQVARDHAIGMLPVVGVTVFQPDA